MKSNGSPRRLRKEPPPEVREWIGCVRKKKTAKHTGRTLREDDVVKFAALLTLVGTRKDPEALRAFEALSGLLLAPGRAQHLGAALEVIPPNRGEILRIVDTLAVWARLTNQTLSAGRCHVARVLATVLEVPDAEAYVSHLEARGVRKLAMVFHPNTLKRAKGEIRGVFSDTSSYWQQTRDSLNVIDD